MQILRYQQVDGTRFPSGINCTQCQCSLPPGWFFALMPKGVTLLEVSPGQIEPFLDREAWCILCHQGFMADQQ